MRLHMQFSLLFFPGIILVTAVLYGTSTYRIQARENENMPTIRIVILAKEI